MTKWEAQAFFKKKKYCALIQKVYFFFSTPTCTLGTTTVSTAKPPPPPSLSFIPTQTPVSPSSPPHGSWQVQYTRGGSSNALPFRLVGPPAALKPSPAAVSMRFGQSAPATLTLSLWDARGHALDAVALSPALTCALNGTRVSGVQYRGGGVFQVCRRRGAGTRAAAGVRPLKPVALHGRPAPGGGATPSPSERGTGHGQRGSEGQNGRGRHRVGCGAGPLKKGFLPPPPPRPTYIFAFSTFR